jgi:ferric-dicitrate binding protein FerR (iron transport regulator)
MNYTVYSVEDFVTDEYFIQWVKNPTDENNAFWNAWLSKNPDKETVVKEARQIVLMLNFKETRAPEGKFLEIWEKISDSDNLKVLDIADHAKKYRQNPLGKWYSIAAVFLLATAAVIYVWVNTQDTIVIQTAFGESRSLFLPDSTKVTLNANSVLRYTADFNEKNREVWLDGEAFFAVVRKKNNQNFRVYTGELQVEVLGTRFNVNTRRGTSKVVLEEGKVKLDIPDGDKSSQLIMLPGEFVEVSGETKKIAKKKVEVSNYSSWRLNKLMFIGASLEEIAQLLEDNYGYKVEFKDNSLKNMRFTGSAAVDNPRELIEKLNKIFDLNIQQENANDLIIQYK